MVQKASGNEYEQKKRDRKSLHYNKEVGCTCSTQRATDTELTNLGHSPWSLLLLLLAPPFTRVHGVCRRMRGKEKIRRDKLKGGERRLNRMTRGGDRRGCAKVAQLVRETASSYAQFYSRPIHGIDLFSISCLSHCPVSV